MKKLYKVVNLPITVPKSNYCWDHETICSNFDNEGGHPSCDLKISWTLDYDEEGKVPKPDKCKKLIGRR